MEWRPKNWGEIKSSYLATGELNNDGTYEDDYTAGFEIGADAIIQALYNEIGNKKIWLDKTDDGHICIFVEQ